MLTVSIIIAFLFYRHTEYIRALNNSHAIPANVQLPLDTNSKPMIELLEASKNCLENNFISSFLTVAGSIVLLHYETILGMQDECPLILCYSSQSGTGINSYNNNYYYYD